jgi:MFS family permease
MESKVSEMIEAQKDKLFTKDYIMLVLFSTVIMVYVQMYLPVMAIYAKLVTGSNFMAGLSPGIFTCASLVAIRCSIPVIKKYGKAGTMAIGSVIMGISAILYFFSRNLYVYLIARIVHGFGNGLCTPANSAAMADVLPKSRLMEGIGYFSVLQTLTGAAARPWPWASWKTIRRLQHGLHPGLYLLRFVLPASFTVTYEKKGLYGAKKAAAARRRASAGNSASRCGYRVEARGPEAVSRHRDHSAPAHAHAFTSGITQAGIGSYLTLSTQERAYPASPISTPYRRRVS